KYQNRERLGFKITGPSRSGFLHSIFPDAQFIFIKRRPLPNIRSMLKVGFYQDDKYKLSWNGCNIYTRREMTKVERWKKDKVPAYIAALQYYKIHEVFENEKEILKEDDRVWEVSFEDFTKNPKEIISGILNTVDLSWDKNIEAYFANNTIY